MAAFEYLSQYESFNSVQEMDQHVEQHIQRHFYDLTESERAIVFKLSSHSLEHTGACHLKASTIADALEISTKTVYRAITKLESLGIIKKVITTKKKGGRGANIYIILPYIEEPCGCPDKLSEQKVIHNKVSTLEAVYDRVYAEKEEYKAYMNEYQQMLYDFMYSLPLSDIFKDELHKVVLASNVSNIQEFIKAKNIIFKIANDIKDGVLTVTKTLRAVFVGAYSKAVERRNKPSTINTSSVDDKRENARPVPLYNWLTERNGSIEVN